MANLHVRSNSLPSESHPIVNDVEDQLCRLKSSEGTSTLTTSVCANLASLRDLHEGINNLIQMPSTQEALSSDNCEKWTSEVMEESLGLVDLCGFARDVMILTKESIQELQSSIRRNRGETATTDEINAYMTSRKRINKMVKKFIKNFKNFDKNCAAFLDEDSDLKAVAGMLKETQALDFSVLTSVVILFSAETGRSKKRSFPFLSKFTQRCRVEDLCSLQQLKASEMNIQELEEGLEAIFRSLLKT